MDTNKILSSDLLDIIFDNRNKAYGAYELRKTYSKRITTALIFTGVFVSFVFTGVVLGNKPDPIDKDELKITTVTVSGIAPDEPEPEPLPTPPPKKEKPPVDTEPYTTVVIKPDVEVQTPPVTVDDLRDSQVGTIKIEGDKYVGTVEAPVLEDPKGIIAEPKTAASQEPLGEVQIQAQFDGDWKRFLERHLNPQVPIDNNAPSGQYTVLIQFVVDVDGSISDIKALNHPGYGLEEEAIRVIKKSKKWEPAIQHGRQVKAYRKQPITFLVTEDY